MCHQTKCCGCVPLRMGCLIIAILQIVLSFVWFVHDGVAYSYSVPVCLIGLAQGVCLLIGVLLNNQILVLISGILALIRIVVTLIVTVLIMVAIGLFASSGAATTVATVAIALLFTFVIIELILDIYFLIVVWSFYKELQAGRRENVC